MVSPSADMLGFEVSSSSAAVQQAIGRPIYLDMQATTPTDPRVLDAMLPYMTNAYGNPHSKTHAYGWESEKAVEEGRKVSSPLLRPFPFAGARRGAPSRCSTLGFLSGLESRLADRVGSSQQRQRRRGAETRFGSERATLTHRSHWQHIADLIGANPKDIVFTSGATESNNMSIKGIARFYKGKKKHMSVSLSPAFRHLANASIAPSPQYHHANRAQVRAGLVSNPSGRRVRGYVPPRADERHCRPRASRGEH